MTLLSEEERRMLGTETEGRGEAAAGGAWTGMGPEPDRKSKEFMVVG